MPSGYKTCALLTDDARVNPFSLREYDEHCKATASTSVTNVCVVGARPTHMADHVQKRVDAACLRDGRYVLTPACVQALAEAPDAPKYRAAGATDPLFSEAQVCRSKLDGTFQAMCEGREVTFDELRKSIGPGCEECCETLVKKAAAAHAPKQPAAHDTPAYIPFRT